MSSEAASSLASGSSVQSEKLIPSPAYRRWRVARKRRAVLILAAQVGLIVFTLVAWEIAARNTWINPLFTSYPTAIAASLFDLFATGKMQEHLATTLIEIVVSFGLSAVGGLGAAIVLWAFPTLQRIVDPFITVANATPKIALVPIFYVWLGATLSIYGVAIALSVFVMLIMIYSGLRQTDPIKIKLARTLGASKGQILRKVVLPANAVTILAALKTNIGLSIAGAIVGEFQAAKAGLGYLILYGSQTFQMDMVLGAVVLLALSSLFLYVIIGALERRAAAVLGL
jgi:NitT/TauT family transport system permease protein